MAGTVILKIVGSAASGIAALQNVQGQMDKTARAAKVLGAAFSAVSAIGTKLIKDATMTAARTQVLGTSLSVVAKLAGYSEDQITGLEESLKSLGITTQVARSSLVRLIQSEVDLSKAAQLARTAQDLTVVSGGNSSETFQRLTTAIATMNPRLLRMTGIVANLNDVFGEHASKLDPVTKKQMLLDYILKEGTKVAGVYEAAMGDVGKAMTSIPRLVEEAKNAFGKHFLPLLKWGVDLVSDFLKWFNKLPEPMQKVIALAAGLATALAGITGPLLLLVGFLPTIAAGFSMLVSVLPVLVPILAGIAGAIAALVVVVQVLKQAWDENWGGIRDLVTNVARELKRWFGKIADDVKYWAGEIKKAWDALVAAFKPLVERIVGLLRRAFQGGEIQNFLSLLRDAVLVVLRLVTQIIQTITGLISGREDAWEPLYEGFLNVMTLIALAWEKFVSKALRWGWNIVVELATGMAKAARQVLTEVVNFIGGLIQDFLGAFSPPKKGPLSQIVEWGKGLINQYIRGFALADFGAIRDALSPIQEALEAAVTVGDIDEEQFVQIFGRVRELAAQLFSEFRRSGEISEEILGRISDTLGEGAQDYVDYIRMTLEYQAALSRLRAVEEEVAAARAGGYVPKELEDQLKAAQEEVDARKEVVDWQREMLAFQQESVDLQLRLVEALEKLTKEISKGGAGAGQLGDSFNVAKDAMAGLKLGVGEFSAEFGAMRARVAEFFENLPDKIKEWLASVDPVGAVLGILDSIMATLIGEEKWGEIKDNFTAKFGELLTGAEGIKDEFLKLAGDLIDGVMAALIGEEKWAALKTEFVARVDDLKDAGLAEKVVGYTAAGLSLLEGVIEGILGEDEWNRLTDDFTGKMETLKDTGILGKILGFTVAAGELLTGIWNGLLNAIRWTELREALKGDTQGLVDQIADFVGNFTQIGMDLINGLLDGLKNAWESVKAWFGSEIELFPDWLKDALNMSSPPPWAIEMGEDIVEGLRQGLDLSEFQAQLGGAFSPAALGAGGAGRAFGGLTVVFAEGAFVGAFPGVTDGRDAGSVMAEIQRFVEQGYFMSQVPGGVTQ